MGRAFVLLLLMLAGCAAPAKPNRNNPAPTLAGASATPTARRGDEIMVCGQMFHTGAPVVLWTDPGGYDAYRVEPLFGARADSRSSSATPTYGTRNADLTTEEQERIRAGGWDLPLLQKHVDQFVIHYDVAGTSRTCFHVLHDQRGLSVHFMLDIDGTIYQTLDLKERAWHATTSNDRSVGIEIANIGAYPPEKDGTLAQWYAKAPGGRTRIILPAYLADGGVRTPGFIGYSSRADPVEGCQPAVHVHLVGQQQLPEVARLAPDHVVEQ